MSINHALLSASSAHRWLNCPPSAKLCESIEDNESDFAKEGTDAHTLCEYKLKKILGKDAINPVENLTYFNAEMDSCAEDYAQFVSSELEKIKETTKDPIVLIEQKLDFSKYVPDGFGYVDCILVGDKTLTVIDFKYGLGVLVSAEMNPQMLCYALGCLELFDALYDIKNIKLVIYQPRRQNISTYEISKDDLIKWANNELTPKAILAFKGEGEFNAGEHCKFCKAKANCRKRAEYNMSLAKYDFKEPPLLDELEISDVLSKIDNLTSWAEDVKNFALSNALKGKKFNGYKVVAGRAIRKYTNEDEVASIVSNEGYDPFEKKLLGITAMTSLLGAKRFEELLGHLTYKPQGKPCLVPESDKRPELNLIEIDFNN